MASSFSFTGFDGNQHIIKNFPDSKYKQFIIYERNGNYRLLFFDSNIVNLSFDDDYFYFNDGLDTVVDLYGYTVSSGIYSYGFKTNVVTSRSSNYDYRIVYASSDLLPFADYLISHDCSINLLSGEASFNASQYVLRSIIEDQDNIPQNIFLEIFDIFPVLLVILVGFIGIRKAIDWLFNLLRNS